MAADPHLRRQIEGEMGKHNVDRCLLIRTYLVWCILGESAKTKWHCFEKDERDPIFEGGTAS